MWRKIKKEDDEILPETKATFFFLSDRPSRFFLLHFLPLISSLHSGMRRYSINHIIYLELFRIDLV